MATGTVSSGLETNGFLRRTVIVLVGKAATGLFGLGTAMVLSRLLPVEIYGNYIQLWLLYNLGFAVLASGFQASISYTVAKVSEDNHTVVLATSFGFLTLSGVIISGIMFAAALFGVAGLGDIKGWLPYFFMLPPVLLAKEAVEAFFVATNRNAEASLLAFLFGLGKFLVLAGLTWWSADIALAHGWYAAIAVLLLLGVLVGTGTFTRLLHGLRSMDRPQLRTQLAVAVPLGLSSAVGALSAQLDKWMVGARLGPKELALYSNGAFEIPIVPIVIGSIVAVGLPEFSRLHRSGSQREMATLWINITRTLALFMVPTFVFACVEAEALIVFLFSDTYSASAPILRIFSVLLLIRVANFGMVFSAIGKPRIVLFGAIWVLVVNLVLNFALIPVLGSSGAAVATVVATFSLAAWYSAGLRSVLGLSLRALYPWQRVVQAALISGTAVFISSRLGLHIAISAILYSVLVLFGYRATGALKDLQLLRRAA